MSSLKLSLVAAAAAAAAAEESYPEVVGSHSGPDLKQICHDQRLRISFASVH